MKIYNTIDKNYYIDKKGIITIGFFDSFHLGHQKILSKLLETSKDNDMCHYVLTYDSLPFKERKRRKIMQFKDKLDLFKSFGIKNVIALEFNKSFSYLTPTKFIKLLRENFNINSFVVGEDFAFGHNRIGTIKDLVKNRSDYDIVPPLYINNERISTSLVKEYLNKGNVKKYIDLCGRSYFLRGIVEKGKQIGRTIGFPTMNTKITSVLLPSDGTYITQTTIKEKLYNSMTYIEGDLVETYLLGYKKFHYNFKIKVDFFQKIRDNQPFRNTVLLKKQLIKDLETIKIFFNE